LATQVQDASTQNGHYKGWLSGNIISFGIEFAKFELTDTVFQRVFDDDNLHDQITKNLYSFGGSSCPTVADPGPTSFNSLNIVGQTAIYMKIFNFDITKTFLLSPPDAFVAVTLNGQYFRTAEIRNTQKYDTEWVTVAYFTPAELSILGNVVPIKIDFLDTEENDVATFSTLKFNGAQSSITFNYNVITGQLSGGGIQSGTYDSQSNFLRVSGDDASIKLYVQKFSIGSPSCSTGTPQTCPGDRPQDILSRNLFCQKRSLLYTVCVQKTTEPAVCLSNQLATESAVVAFTDLIDVVIVGGCTNYCGLANQSRTRYQFYLYGPDSKTLDQRSADLSKSLTNNLLPSFNVISFTVSHSSHLFVSYIISLIVCVIYIL